MLAFLPSGLPFVRESLNTHSPFPQIIEIPKKIFGYYAVYKCTIQFHKIGNKNKKN